MFEILEKYTHKGHFNFSLTDRLISVCNAPNDRSGIYLVWDSTDKDNLELLYVGRSGKKKDGIIVHRKAGLGGMKDRLVNGHQFGTLPRKKIWPLVMEQSGIKTLSISWYDTEEDDPVMVERKILEEIIRLTSSMPKWNNQPY